MISTSMKNSAFASHAVCSLAALTLAFSAAAADPEKPAEGPKPEAPPKGKAPERIEVQAQRQSDTDLRRNSTASKIVVGREEIERQGDATLGEVLKRLPGVTMGGAPGRGGDIRMRGMGRGYTQILLNGEPAPRGFSMDTLSPDQVERIEIFRAPTAEFRTAAIAGTINIVLREALQRKDNTFRIGGGGESNRRQSGASVERNDHVDNLTYNASAGYFERSMGNQSHTVTTGVDPVTGSPVLAQDQRDQSGGHTAGVHLSSRFTWRLDKGDSLMLNPFLVTTRTGTSGGGTLDQTLGLFPAPYVMRDYAADARNTSVRLFGNWSHTLDGGAKMQMRGSAGTTRANSETPGHEYDPVTQAYHSTYNRNDQRDSSITNGGKVTWSLANDHRIASGWDLEYAQRRETTSTLRDGVSPLAAFDGLLSTSTRRLAAFAQDEWDISPLWSAYGGLRWEGVRIESDWTAHGDTNASSVVSPLFHSVWRFSEEAKDQVRLSLTRSYRPPTLQNLVARPTLASGYPADGPNSATRPDSQGNPNLKPELAWGLETAYEHYLPQGGMFSVNVFYRRIDNLIRTLTQLQSVSWSSTPRWVAQPQNIGTATAAGLELEWKFRLNELLADAPPLEMRANASRFWSQVQGVPGPDNRLASQPKATGNIGADYRFRVVPLTVGGSINLTPAYEVRDSASQYSGQGRKRVIDAYGLWRFNMDTQLRLSFSNLAPHDYQTLARDLVPGLDQTARTDARTYLNWNLRLETKF